MGSGIYANSQSKKEGGIKKGVWGLSRNALMKDRNGLCLPGVEVKGEGWKKEQRDKKHQKKSGKLVGRGSLLINFSPGECETVSAGGGMDEAPKKQSNKVLACFNEEKASAKGGIRALGEKKIFPMRGLWFRNGPRPVEGEAVQIMMKQTKKRWDRSL